MCGVVQKSNLEMAVKKTLLIAALALASVQAVARPEVGVTVQINQPGVYGRVDIGRVPAPPVLLYPEPVVMVPGQVVVHQRPPIYLHVPPGHSRHWRKHCHRYNACGQPVYFVRDDWYQRHYDPEHRRDWEHDRRRPDDRGHGRGDDWDDGHGRKHGRGHGHGGRHDD